MQREVQKKAKAEAKRARRKKLKDDALISDAANVDIDAPDEANPPSSTQ